MDCPELAGIGAVGAPGIQILSVQIVFDEFVRHPIGDPKVLIVFTCSGRDNTCTSYQIPPDGTDPHAGKMTIDGDTWTFPWSTTEDGKTVWFRVVNTWSSPTSIQYRQEFSTDHVHWTPMSVGHEVKAG